jgi:protein farnesyltransferase subunit beta
MQGLPVEIGGFRGRSNKLVDGCYSWWCGGLFNIIEALLAEQGTADSLDPPFDLYNRVGLQEYVLIAAQGPHGGLRDKPGKGSDAYHSCYNLSGLSSAQHAVSYKDVDLVQELSEEWIDPREEDTTASTGLTQVVKGKNETGEEASKRMKDVFIAALAWKEDESRKIVIGRKDSESDNEVALTHPIYNVVMPYFDKIMRWSYGQPPKVGIEEVSE